LHTILSVLASFFYIKHDKCNDKNIKSGRGKGENVKEKGRKGKENEKRGSKTVK
jgi:hypothetical protein